MLDVALVLLPCGTMDVVVVDCLDMRKSLAISIKYLWLQTVILKVELGLFPSRSLPGQRGRTSRHAMPPPSPSYTQSTIPNTPPPRGPTTLTDRQHARPTIPVPFVCCLYSSVRKNTSVCCVITIHFYPPTNQPPKTPPVPSTPPPKKTCLSKAATSSWYPCPSSDSSSYPSAAPTVCPREPRPSTPA